MPIRHNSANRDRLRGDTADARLGRSRERPNVLLITCHDLGRHLGCYDRGVETPNVDGLAEDGVLLENHFCTAPQCCPSRGSLLTGRHPHRNGLMGQVTWGWELPDDETTLSQHLSRGGYSTHVFGVQHVRQDSRTIYDRVHEEGGRALEIADRFAADLPELADDDGPFFAALGFAEPHLTDGDDPPWTYRFPDVPDEAFDRYDPEAVEPMAYLPDRPSIREQIANLNGLITATVDEAVRKLLGTLSDAGLEEDTLVIFTTDHGLAFPRAKGTCYDPGIEAAFVARLPRVFDGGERYDELTSHVDVVPTVLELLGLPIPDDLDGYSFLPMVTGAEYEPREYVHAEMTWHERYAPMRAVRTKQYKYVRNFWKQQRVHLPADVFGSLAGRELREEYYITERPREELYDLRMDPDEREKLASSRGVFDPDEWEPRPETPGAGEEPDADHTEQLQTLRTVVTEWMERTNDPLLDGPVMRPNLES